MVPEAALTGFKTGKRPKSSDDRIRIAERTFEAVFVMSPSNPINNVLVKFS
jgi:hypothetical protein